MRRAKNQILSLHPSSDFKYQVILGTIDETFFRQRVSTFQGLGSTIRMFKRHSKNTIGSEFIFLLPGREVFYLCARQHPTTFK